MKITGTIGEYSSDVWLRTDSNAGDEDEFDAYHLPDEKYDYIFSSHTLEHLLNYVEALRYWKEHLVVRGVLFLYLPHPTMEYWLPQNNPKLLKDLGFEIVLHSERDLYWSFSVIGVNL